MNLRKKILFIVHTEYHLMVALSLITDQFSDEQEFDIWLIQTIGYNSTRFKFNKNLSGYHHVSYQELIYDEGLIERNNSFIEYVKRLSGTRIDYFISFNKLAYIDFFTYKSLSKTGTRIILSPDGAAAYGVFSWFTPRWSLLVSINTHRYLWKNGIKEIYLYWPTLVYGAIKEINELWAQFPESIDARASKPSRKIDILKSEKSKTLIKNYFGYQSSQSTTNIIFYTNQPFRDPKINDFEIELLSALRKKFPDRIIKIKLHPTTYPEQERRFNNLSNVEIIKSTIPAELFIADLQNSIVLGFWSTSMLVNNDTCRFYWLFPLLFRVGIELRKMKVKNPSPHVTLVNSIDDIV